PGEAQGRAGRVVTVPPSIRLVAARRSQTDREAMRLQRGTGVPAERGGIPRDDLADTALGGDARQHRGHLVEPAYAVEHAGDALELGLEALERVGPALDELAAH